MTMAYWLVKSEPSTWSWDMQVAKGAKGEAWTGVRNFTARQNLVNMKKGDSEPVEDSGHLLYNVAKNGHTRVASHLTGIDPVNIDEDGKTTPKPGYEQYTTTLKRMDDAK